MCKDCEKENEVLKEIADTIGEQIGKFQVELDAATEAADKRLDAFGPATSAAAHRAKVEAAQAVWQDWLNVGYAPEYGDDVASDTFKAAGRKAMRAKLDEMSLEEICYQSKLLKFYEQGVGLLSELLDHSVLRRMGNSLSMAQAAKSTPQQMVA